MNSPSEVMFKHSPASETKSNRTSSSPSLTEKWSLDQQLIQTAKSKTLMEVSDRLTLTVSFGERIQIFLGIEFGSKIFRVQWSTGSIETRPKNKLWWNNFSRSKELRKLFQNWGDFWIHRIQHEYWLNLSSDWSIDEEWSKLKPN